METTNFEGVSPLDVPCYECICIPVCRNKTFFNLLKQCSKIDYFYHNEGMYDNTIDKSSSRLIAISLTLNPIWRHKIKIPISKTNYRRRVNEKS